MKKRLNKKRVLTLLQKRTGLSKRFLNNFLSELVEKMVFSLDLGERIKIIKFGTFEVKKVAGRLGRDFKSGERIRISGLRKASFHPAKELRNFLNEIKEKEK